MSERVLEVNNLHVSFDITAGEVQAVRGVDFFLNKGETLAIVGESGSGKSVTTKAITKLFQGDTGRIKKGTINFLGEDLACLLYTSPSPRDLSTSRMPSSA